jgi:hypothetical protein
VVVVLALVLYVLSSGPAIWALERGYLPNSAEPVAALFYYPLKWLSDQSPTFYEWLYWWARLWG